MVRSSICTLSQLVVLIYIMLWCSPSMGSRPGPGPGPGPGFLFTATTHLGRCTPQYWGSREEKWPKMVPQRSTVSKVFGSRATERFRSDLTLLEAATRNDDVDNAFERLLKQSTAALLNSYARVGYPYKAWEIKALFLRGLISEKDAARQAQILMKANEACT